VTFEYCETCRKISYGGYFTSTDKNIKIYHCRICYSITYLSNNILHEDAWFNDFNLRNESIKLQRERYKR